jgi:hypothetical protein
MEINLVLTAKSWQLASQLQRTKPFGRVMMVKNIPERSYLAITAKQWQVLARFEQPQTVPEVLESIIGDRICPALGEFYELILKAVQARILVEPGQTVATVPAVNWPLSLTPNRFCRRLRFLHRPASGAAAHVPRWLCECRGAAAGARLGRGSGRLAAAGRWGRGLPPRQVADAEHGRAHADARGAAHGRAGARGDGGDGHGVPDLA